jgi:hypothetical protein
MDSGFIEGCSYIEAYIYLNLCIEFLNFTLNFTHYD